MMSSIAEKRDDLVRAGFPLGDPIGSEVKLPDGGRYQDFEGATIYWSRESGAHAVQGAILGSYRERGGPAGALGYPLTDQSIGHDGRSMHTRFANGALYLDSAHPQLGVYHVPRPLDPCRLDPPTGGRWELPPFDSAVVGVHAALMGCHHVLFFSYHEEPGCPSRPVPWGASAVVDMQTGFHATPPYYNVNGVGQAFMENLFCAGQAFLPDGSLLVAGGEREDDVRRFTEAVRAIHIFQSGGAAGGKWVHVANCARGRWYTTCATLPDGNVIIVGGSVRATHNPLSNVTFEIYDWGTNTVSPEVPIPDSAFAWWSSYPFVIVLPDNRALIHFGTRTRFLNLATRQFEPTALEAAARPGRNGRTYGLEGSAVLLPLRPGSNPPYTARVMVIGGGGSDPININTPATTTCEILDLGVPSPAWALGAPMNHPRVMPDAVLLPDGKVFVCNGSSAGHADLGKDPVFEPEVYDPATNSWQVLCPMTVPRLYHATALLLADGRVMTAGTDCAWNPAPYNLSQLKIELYSPPYCFAPRPHIGYLQPHLHYGEAIQIPTDHADRIREVVLLRRGSVTHSFNSDQRYVELVIAERHPGVVTAIMPTDGALLPPGPYLLFVVDRKNVPSIGRCVLLCWRDPACRPVSAKRREFPREPIVGVIDDLTLSSRVSVIEQAVARLSGFVEAQQGPLFRAHGLASHPLPMPGETHHAELCDGESHDQEDDGGHGGAPHERHKP